MSVITKESLSRGYFSLYAPIKYACGFIVYKKESELEWLAQCGKCPKVPGSIPGGAHVFLDIASLHGDFCMLLCGTPPQTSLSK